MLPPSRSLRPAPSSPSPLRTGAHTNIAMPPHYAALSLAVQLPAVSSHTRIAAFEREHIRDFPALAEGGRLEIPALLTFVVTPLEHRPRRTAREGPGCGSVDIRAAASELSLRRRNALAGLRHKKGKSASAARRAVGGRHLLGRRPIHRRSRALRRHWAAHTH